MALDVFDIIGPIMIGPSSSHTAGAVRLGRLARAIFGELPQQVDIYLHGSFAKTYKGHGTDVALVAGLLGLDTDDEGIVSALDLAKERGVIIKFIPSDLGDVHPNTVKLVMKKGEKLREVLGSSIGGGNVVVTQVDGFPVDLRGEYYTLVVLYRDRPGIVAKVTALLAQNNINIAKMRVSREGKGAQALMVVETDDYIPDEILEEAKKIEDIQGVLKVMPI